MDRHSRYPLSIRFSRLVGNNAGGGGEAEDNMENEEDSLDSLLWKQRQTRHR